MSSSIGLPSIADAKVTAQLSSSSFHLNTRSSPPESVDAADVQVVAQVSASPPLSKTSDSQAERTVVAHPSSITFPNTNLEDFQLFPILPIELSFEIWSTACYFPRKITLLQDNWLIRDSTRKIEGQSRIPPVLQVCKESRAEAFKHYVYISEEPTRFCEVRRIHGGQLCGQSDGVFINFEVDILSQASILLSEFSLTYNSLSMFPRPKCYNFHQIDTKRFRNLEVQFEGVEFSLLRLRHLLTSMNFGGGMKRLDIAIDVRSRLPEDPSSRLETVLKKEMMSKETDWLKEFEKGKEGGKYEKNLVLRIKWIEDHSQL